MAEESSYNCDEIRKRLPSSDCIPCCSCLTLCVLGFVLGCWESIRIKIEMGKYTPDTQFKRMDNRCVITWSEYMYLDDRDCIDHYRFGFVIKNGPLEEFTSANVSLYRWPCVDVETKWRLKSTKKGTCDDCSPMRNGSERVGESVHCWHTTVPVSDLPSGYHCGNEDCYKIEDPEDNLMGAITINSFRFYGGMISCFVSCIYGCCICCGCCDCCFQHRGDDPSLPPGHPDLIGKPVRVEFNEETAATHIQAVHRGRAARNILKEEIIN